MHAQVHCHSFLIGLPLDGHSTLEMRFVVSIHNEFWFWFLTGADFHANSTTEFDCHVLKNSCFVDFLTLWKYHMHCRLWLGTWYTGRIFLFNICFRPFSLYLSVSFILPFGFCVYIILLAFNRVFFVDLQYWRALFCFDTFYYCFCVCLLSIYIFNSLIMNE